MPRILFVAAHRPGRSPSQRFRFEQYLSYLKEKGFDHTFSYIISDKDDKIFYTQGKLLNKIIVLLKSFFKRLENILNTGKYDIIFVQREAFMTGSTFFEKCFSKSKAKLVFDFDDSIWLLDISDANKKFEMLKNPKKTSKIISIADVIFAGNNYLAKYAKQFNSNVKIVPTTIDTEEYTRITFKKKETVCIGWSGSITTIKHFEYAIPFLEKIKQKYGERVSIKVIGDSKYNNPHLNIKGLAWDKENELKELSTFDIGIMPLPDDEWAKGKCGLKGLQYMALEIPTIMSPVGVNTDIIKDGVNGYLGTDINDWINKLSMLIDSEELRNRIGKEARKTVVEKYSVLSQRDNYVSYFKELLN